MKEGMNMNRNPKKIARIELRVKPKDKDRINKLAEKCNLSVNEYILQRALGYEPKTVQPDAFFDWWKSKPPVPLVEQKKLKIKKK